MTWNYLDAYIEETKEQLSRLEQLFLEMEQNPHQSNVLNEIFRIMHTLKGSSATMGFGEVADFCHNLENLFDGLRKDKIIVNSDLIDNLFESLDTLKNMINAVIKGEAYESNAEKLIEIINSYINGDSSKTIDNLSENALWKVSIKISSDCPMKTARAMVIEKYIEEISNVVNIEPSFDLLASGQVECEEISAVIKIQRNIENVVLELKNLQDVADVDIRQFSKDETFLNDIKINLSKLYNPEELKRIKEDLIHSDEVKLEIGERCIMNLGLLQLILAARKENKVIRCEKGGGPVVKMLKLMGVF